MKHTKKREDTARQSLWRSLHGLVVASGDVVEAKPLVFKPVKPHEPAQALVGCPVKLADGLKIVRQYGKVLTSSVKGLVVSQPLHVDHVLDAAYARQLGLFERVARHSSEQGMAELCYELHQTMPCYDKGLTRHLLSLCFPTAQVHVFFELGLNRVLIIFSGVRGGRGGRDREGLLGGEL